MMSELSEESRTSQIDLFKEWVQFWDGWTKAWSGPMSEAVASKGFAESMGQQLEGALEAAAMMRQQMGGVMQQILQQMSLPTRQDVVRLAERLTNLEMRLDDLDATTGEILDLLKAAHEPGDESPGG
jgi:polyhydroxyalkanoate synthesis regulator phasin